MGNIYVTSDLHLCHNRQWIFQPRGFNSIGEMNEAIVTNWNNIVYSDDEVYVLGDLMLNDNETGLKLLKSLKGNIHIVAGNHDTDRRRADYAQCGNVLEVQDALRLNYNGYHFFMTHYPCITGSLEKDSLKKCTCNLFGHTHQNTNFYQDMPFMYHVGVDSHNCTPILIDQAIQDMEAKVLECMKQL